MHKMTNETILAIYFPKILGIIYTKAIITKIKIHISKASDCYPHFYHLFSLLHDDDDYDGYDGHDDYDGYDNHFHNNNHHYFQKNLGSNLVFHLHKKKIK